MDESACWTKTRLHEMSARQLLSFRRRILETDKPFELPPTEEQEVDLITSEILSRVVEPVHATIPTGPHTDLQILLGAIAIVLTVLLVAIPGLEWLQDIFSVAICCWFAWHWQYLFPGRVKA